MAQPSPMSALLRQAASTLRSVGIDSPAMEARALACGVLGLSREDLLADPHRPIGPASARRFNDAVCRRAAHEPFARIVGKREFWSKDFVLGPDTLIPRPETETVVESVLRHVSARLPELSVLDLGTGSGCLLSALLGELPMAWGLGTDCAENAVMTARQNAERLGLGARARFVVADWGSSLSGTFDVVVCNPPYVAERDRDSLAPEVRDHDPPRALFAGRDGLAAYRTVLPDIARLLDPDGLAAVELGDGQIDEVGELATCAGLSPIDTGYDLAGIARVCVMAKTTVAFRKNKMKKRVGKSSAPV